MAEILSVSVNTARRWLHDGRLEPSYRKGRTYYWLRSDLDEILRNSEGEKK
ncbi:MAG: helix-turn-helix domain-containing protein [Lewinellaceae bacterium]|nr:helix-turn-helix domain-containing protein [Lewinellaceae bacterium]